MFEEFKVYILGGVLIAACAGTAFVMHKFDDAELEKVKLTNTKAESDRNALLVTQYGQAVKDRDALQTKINNDVQLPVDNSKVENAKIDTLADCLNSAKCRLRFATSSAPGHAADSNMPKAAPVDTGTSPGTDPAIRQNYLALRRAIIVTETALASCQKYGQDMDAN